MAIEQRIESVESGGNRYARNPRSSAYGPGQFLGSTWLNMVARYRPDLMQGRSRAELLELRSDPAISSEMTRRYSEENGRYLQSKGFPADEGNLYLAHFAGPAGAAALLANPDKSAGEVLGRAVVEANPFLANWKARDVDAWADRKMGWTPMTGAPTTASAITAKPSPGANDDMASAVNQSNTAPIAPKQRETAVLPFLASLFNTGAATGAAGAAGGAAGAGSLGSALANSGGLLSSLFSEGGFDFNAMLNDKNQPQPTNPIAGAPAPSPMGVMPRAPVDMRGLQAMIANRPRLGAGPGVLG